MIKNRANCLQKRTAKRRSAGDRSRRLKESRGMVNEEPPKLSPIDGVKEIFHQVKIYQKKVESGEIALNRSTPNSAEPENLEGITFELRLNI